MNNEQTPPHGIHPRIRVLIVEDSAVARQLLTYLLNSDPAIHVIDAVSDGREGIKAAALKKPDLITMDIHMPGLNGFETTRAIMESNPTPILIVTCSCDLKELEISFRAIEAGALAVLQKPQGMGHPDFEKNARQLIKMVKLMSEVKVVRRWARSTSPRREIECVISPTPDTVNIVAIGASTGGPPVIEKILSALPSDFGPPILIVQHMAEGFIRGFVEWLGQTSALPVHLACHGNVVRGGNVYVAPDGFQMKIDRNGRIGCTSDGSRNGLRPSVSCLFQSVQEVYGKNAIGILLTGMGKDGAWELKLMKDTGAITIAQNEQSSAVFGMPGEAVRLGAARYVLPDDKIAAVLTGLVMSKNTKNVIH